MDELELLKKDWKEREQKHPKLSYDQIYDMLFRKSTSIVKWIFIISIAELILWTAISLFTPKSSIDLVENLGLMNMMIYTNIVHYLIFIGFIYLFYKNYSTIRVTDSTKKLMNNILKTRKTVKYFVIYNISFFAVMFAFFTVFYTLKSDIVIEFLIQEYGEISTDDGFFTGFIVANIVVAIVMIGILALFYRIVYGIFLRRLKKNYNELERIEI